MSARSFYRLSVFTAMPNTPAPGSDSPTCTASSNDTTAAFGPKAKVKGRARPFGSLLDRVYNRGHDTLVDSAVTILRVLRTVKGHAFRGRIFNPLQSREMDLTNPCPRNDLRHIRRSNSTSRQDFNAPIRL